MHIVCPNCGTSYDVDAAALGPAGRSVRCVRCRETWLARVDDMVRADALVQAADEIGGEQAAPQAAMTAEQPQEVVEQHELPQVESPPLVHDAVPAENWTAASQRRQHQRPRVRAESSGQSRESSRSAPVRPEP